MPRSLRFLPVALLALLAVGAHAQGVLAFETLEHDFGSVAEGEKPTHVFTFTNTGDQPVTLTSVRPSCGCTAPSYSTEPVAPGAQGQITVEYNSQGRPGAFNKSISVEADGADPEHVTLYITGTVIPANIRNGDTQGHVVFDAERIEFGPLAPEAPVAHTFKMQNVGERPIRITGARALAEAAEVTFPTRPVFPGDIVEITVAVPRADAAVNPHGQFDVSVVLDTDDAEFPAKSLRLRGRLAESG